MTLINCDKCNEQIDSEIAVCPKCGFVRFLSHAKPISEKKYTQIPFGESPWNDKRNVAHEEVCRDLDKSTEQLLIDTHDESLDRNPDRKPFETICRTMARMASMQLRIEQETKKTNCILLVIGVVGTILAGFAVYYSYQQAYFSELSYKEQVSQRPAPLVSPIVQPIK